MGSWDQWRQQCIIIYYNFLQLTGFADMSTQRSLWRVRNVPRTTSSWCSCQTPVCTWFGKLRLVFKYTSVPDQWHFGLIADPWLRGSMAVSNRCRVGFGSYYFSERVWIIIKKFFKSVFAFLLLSVPVHFKAKEVAVGIKVVITNFPSHKDPDPASPKTCGSGTFWVGSRSARLYKRIMITVYFLEDSTFNMVTCCPPFTQIVFLQAKIGDKRPLPAAFALLTRKESFFCTRWPSHTGR